MSNCVQCGSTIPESQRTCSMCYGDIAHGKDGYYEAWAKERMDESSATYRGESQEGKRD